MSDEEFGTVEEARAAIMARVFDLVADGRSLQDISGRDGLPSARTIYRWMRENEAFSKQYEDAQEERVEALAHETLELADNVDEDSAVAVQAARLKIDTRKWLAEKLYGRRYGSKQQVDLSGSVKVDHEAMLEAARKRRESGRDQG